MGQELPAGFAIKLKTSNYRYLWLRYVTGFKQGSHCAKCLKGHWSKIIDWTRPGFRGHLKGWEGMGTLDEHAAPFVYLCGVSKRGWADNLHVVMRPNPGASIFHKDDNCVVCVDGMERVAFDRVPGSSEAMPSEFWTCRNWQAGWTLFPADRKPFAAPLRREKAGAMAARVQAYEQPLLPFGAS